MNTIKIPFAPLRHEPDEKSGLDTELLYGERVKVIETRGPWAGVENETDGYMGWMLSDQLDEDTERSHIVTALGSYVYATPDLKSPASWRLPFLARVCAFDEKDDYLRVPQGWLHKATLVPVGVTIAQDPVEVARRFIDVPYKWGGRSPAGLDCSALVQLSFAACGIALPRDTGKQRDALKQDKSLEELAAGDLIYTPGHVMLATGPTTVIHANAHHMRVAEEALEAALKRFKPNELEERVVKGKPD